MKSRAGSVGGNRGWGGAASHPTSASALLRWRLWALGLLLVAPFGTAAALAQMSPHCERNGRREFCAVTSETNAPPQGAEEGFEQPGEATSDGEGSAGDTPKAEPLTLWVVFADHSKVKLTLAEHTCKDNGQQRLCQATMQAMPGGDQPSAAQYLGTAYEGGYRHEYTMPGLKIVFSYLD